MTSSYTPKWKRFLIKHLPFLFIKCPGGNYHNKNQKYCSCIRNENSSGDFIYCKKEWIPVDHIKDVYITLEEVVDMVLIKGVYINEWNAIDVCKEFNSEDALNKLVYVKKQLRRFK